MPFKSKAQRRKFYALKARGEMSQKEIDQWEKETKNKNLPERVGMITKEAAYELGQKVAIASAKLPYLNFRGHILGGGILGGALGAGAGALMADDAGQGALMGGATGAGVGALKQLLSVGLLNNAARKLNRYKEPLMGEVIAPRLLGLLPLATAAGGYMGSRE